MPLQKNKWDMSWKKTGLMLEDFVVGKCNPALVSLSKEPFITFELFSWSCVVFYICYIIQEAIDTIKASDEEYDFVIQESALKPASIPVTEVEPSPALGDITETLTVKTLKRKQKNDKSKRLKEVIDRILFVGVCQAQLLSLAVFTTENKTLFLFDCFMGFWGKKSCRDTIFSSKCC